VELTSASLLTTNNIKKALHLLAAGGRTVLPNHAKLRNGHRSLSQVVAFQWTALDWCSD